MRLFKKKQEEPVDPRTDIERKFEEKGGEIGLKTGTIVQKGVNKYNTVKQKWEQDGTMDKLRNVSDKIDDTIDKVVDTVSKKGKQLANKVQTTKKDEPEDLFYE